MSLGFENIWTDDIGAKHLITLNVLLVDFASTLRIISIRTHDTVDSTAVTDKAHNLFEKSGLKVFIGIEDWPQCLIQFIL